MKDKLSLLLESALSALNLPARPAMSADRQAGGPKGKEFSLKSPPRPEFGDLASNAPLLIAQELKQNPISLAQELKGKVAELDRGKICAKIEVANHGFLNFFLSDSFLQNEILGIVKNDQAYGKSQALKGRKILLEFVSANPTGPLHVGHGRWAVLGDCLGQLLEAVGAKVEREYYVNNVGTQVEKLIESVKAVKAGKEIPEGGYGGAYLKQIPMTNDQIPIKEFILNYIIAEQKKTLENLGIKFDRWFYESELHEKNKVKWAVEKLHEAGKTFEEDGAIWFKSQEMGDDKNRVLIRDDGAPTYFASDIAYHLDKFFRGFDQIINIWGTDHHGYVARLKAAITALNLPVDKLEIIIGQLVTLYRGKEPVRMSKRTGEMVTLQEVVDEIGKDATRFFFAASNVNSHLDFDLELAKKQSAENPVYYVQYAHARICSILRKSQIPMTKSQPGTDLSELKHPTERMLMLKLDFFPDIVEEAAKSRQPHMLTEYGKELAAVFHNFYEKCRVLENPGRLTLIEATRIVLRNLLELLGISAPEKM